MSVDMKQGTRLLYPTEQGSQGSVPTGHHAPCSDYCCILVGMKPLPQPGQVDRSRHLPCHQLLPWCAVLELWQEQQVQDEAWPWLTFAWCTHLFLPLLFSFLQCSDAAFCVG